jgi:hypothetical protein
MTEIVIPFQKRRSLEKGMRWNYFVSLNMPSPASHDGGFTSFAVPICSPTSPREGQDLMRPLDEE